MIDKQKIEQSQLDLSIVIVNFNARDLLENCLKSVFARSENLTFEVIVVDNNSTDGSVQMLEEFPSKIQVLVNNKNVGFAKANNQAIVRGRGRYVLLLNPDTVVLPNALLNLDKFMDRHPEIGATGCK